MLLCLFAELKFKFERVFYAQTFQDVDGVSGDRFVPWLTTALTARANPAGLTKCAVLSPLCILSMQVCCVHALFPMHSNTQHQMILCAAE